MEIFAAISSNEAYNQQDLHVTMVNRSFLLEKLKSDGNDQCLKGSIRYTFLFCRDAFTFLRKHWLLSVSLTFCFITKINYKNETGIIANFIFWSFINSRNHQDMFWKMLKRWTVCSCQLLLFWCLFLWTYFTPVSSIVILKLELVNIDWENDGFTIS